MSASELMFRHGEADMRRKRIEADLVECVLGLGPNLSCNSLLEACVVVRVYRDFKDEPGFTRVAPIEAVRAKDGNPSIPQYVCGGTQVQTDAVAESATTALPGALAGWLECSSSVRRSLDALLSSTK